MQTKYYFFAKANGERARALLDEFVSLFGQNATSIDRWDFDDIQGNPGDARPAQEPENDHVGVNMVIPFDPQLAERGKCWAARFPEIEFRENFLREFTNEDCKAAPLCTLRFPNCYIFPEEYSWRPCPGCRGDRPEATGNVADKIEIKKGIGKSHGRFFASKSMAKEIAKANLKGFQLNTWQRNKRYSLIEPKCVLNELLLEGKNVLGLEATTCAGCGRPGRRYIFGPEIVDESGYAGEDIVRVKGAMCRVPQTWLDDFAFSQLAAKFFVTYLRVAKYSRPIFYRSSDVPVVS
jgi:hypothetical protein